ncbi:hypothetical protein [Paratractidigestivibacter sp.]|uniref:hypothetical protein n=1 Tax=Paratractidigestivibacter sp. TaxID=2847316 RepID=UPI002AC9BE9B|nr:hypothetical protein [Paratractidigestivibacter sp.]
MSKENVMSSMLIALLIFIGGFLMGASLMYDKKQDEDALETRVDDQQMRLDILVDELKRSKIGSEINWDRL